MLGNIIRYSNTTGAVWCESMLMIGINHSEQRESTGYSRPGLK